MDEAKLKAILESLLFAAGEPVSLSRLAAVMDTVSRDELKRALAALGSEYASGERGLTLEEVAGGYQLRTRTEFAAHIRKLLASKPPRLSRSLLETLAIVAYRQPITRPEIEELRGVDSGGVLETLLERRFVKIAGRKDAPGRPLLYATTAEFLEVFALKDLESLPDLKEFQEIERAAEEAESKGVETITDGGEVGSEIGETRTATPEAQPVTDTPGETLETAQGSEQSEHTEAVPRSASDADSSAGSEAGEDASSSGLIGEDGGEKEPHGS